MGCEHHRELVRLSSRTRPSISRHRQRGRILQGLHKDIANPEKAERFTVSAPISFQFLEVTAEIAYLASKIIADLELKRQAIGFPDSLIAATAIHHGLTLVTANTRHFPRVADLGYPLALQNWRSIG